MAEVQFAATEASFTTSEIADDYEPQPAIRIADVPPGKDIEFTRDAWSRWSAWLGQLLLCRTHGRWSPCRPAWQGTEERDQLVVVKCACGLRRRWCLIPWGMGE